MGVLGFVSACATGEVEMRVRTPEPLARIELTETSSGRKVYVPSIPPGESNRVETVRPGTWCITGSTPAGHYSPSMEPKDRMCASVAAGARGEFGHVAFDGVRLTRATELEPPKAEIEARSLDSVSIKQAMVRVKPGVQACMFEQQLPEGTVLRVKISISGATGEVKTAEVLPPYTDHAVAPCVRDWLLRAEFPRFQGGRIGVIYPFRLRTRLWEAASEARQP